MKRQRLCRTTHASWLRPQTLAPMSARSSGAQYFSSTTSTGLGWRNSENTLTALSDRGSTPHGLPSLFGVVFSGLIFQAARTKPEALEETYKEALTLETGDGVPQDLEKAITLYEKGVRADHLPSLHRLGLILLRNNDATDEEVNRGLKLLADAAEEGYEPASFNLNCLYIFGPWMEPPLLEAIMQIEKLTEGLLWPGDADKLLASGQPVPEERQVDANFHKEVATLSATFEQYAKQGFPIAHLLLGSLHEKGWGTQKDLDKALHHYSQAGEGAAEDIARVTLKKKATSS